MGKKDEIVLRLSGKCTDVWRRMQESLGSSDEVMISYAVAALAQFVEAESEREIITRSGRNGARKLGLPVRHGLIKPFSIKPDAPTTRHI